MSLSHIASAVFSRIYPQNPAKTHETQSPLAEPVWLTLLFPILELAVTFVTSRAPLIRSSPTQNSPLERCPAERFLESALSKWSHQKLSNVPPEQGADFRFLFIEGSYFVMKSNPLLISSKAIYFQWTYCQKGLEFSASLGSCIQRHWSVLLL